MTAEYEKAWRMCQRIRTRLADAILQRDELLFWDSAATEEEYTKKVGLLEYKAREFQYQAERLQKKEQLLRRAAQEQDAVLLPQVEKVLDKAMEKKAQQLLKRRQQLNGVLMRDSVGQPAAAVGEQIRRIYRTLILHYHRDLHPQQTDNDKLLFLSGVAAFRTQNVERLRQIEIILLPITETTEPDQSLEELKNECARLRAKWALTLQQIRAIQSSFPLNQAAFLLNEQRVRERQAELQEEIETARAVYQQAEIRLAELLGE